MNCFVCACADFLPLPRGYKSVCRIECRPGWSFLFQCSQGRLGCSPPTASTSLWRRPLLLLIHGRPNVTPQPLSPFLRMFEVLLPPLFVSFLPLFLEVVGWLVQFYAIASSSPHQISFSSCSPSAEAFLTNYVCHPVLPLCLNHFFSLSSFRMGTLPLRRTTLALRGLVLSSL